MIICQTPFRISFFGGGTDFPEYFTRHGGAVLGSAIDKYIVHSVTSFPSKLFDYCIRLAYRQVECVKTVDQIEHHAFREVLRFFEIDRDVEVTLTADLPAFAGLGSSSSFTVGLIQALMAYQGRFISRFDLAQLAIHIERKVLNECVGCQDQVFAAYGGLNVIEFRREDDFTVHRVVLAPDRLAEMNASLLLFFTGQTRRAAAIEAEKLARMDQNGPVLKKLRRMVDEGHDILCNSQPLMRFGELLHEGWSLKRELSSSVTTSQIDSMYESARKAGASGGKLLGAGGGGFLLLFVPPERQSNVRKALGNFFEIPFRINASGSAIIHS